MGKKSFSSKKSKKKMSSTHTFSRVLKTGFDTVLANTRNALKENGFGVLTEIDFKKAFKEKIDKDVLPCVQLGACNPQLAYKVYSSDPSIATFLPCHVVVRAQRRFHAGHVGRSDENV